MSSRLWARHRCIRAVFDTFMGALYSRRSTNGVFLRIQAHAPHNPWRKVLLSADGRSRADDDGDDDDNEQNPIVGLAATLNKRPVCTSD